MNNNFDWLQPSLSPAHITAATEAYESNYDFTEGFQTSNEMISKSTFCVPESVDLHVHSIFVTHQVVMNHPLCNIQQNVDWLIKPVGNSINRIDSSLGKNTQSSTQDA